MKSNKSVYDVITNRIIEALEQGVVPWRKPWKCGAPANLVTKNEYRGINTIILAMNPYSSPYFATIKQVNQLGGKVKKGEKGFPVVFWKFPDPDRKRKAEGKKDDDGDNQTSKESVPIIRYYTVFNVDQCEGLEGKIPIEERIVFNPIEQCEKVVGNYPDKPPIIHEGHKACYRPIDDEVFMPIPESFVSSQHYYAVLFHELVHSTGHEKRLAREGVKDFSLFGDHKYSKEELVAEIGASFLCGTTGLDTGSVFANQVAYLQSWLDVLKNDKRMIVHAAANAQKAVDHILNVKKNQGASDNEMAA